jgi:hypothetical protein
VPARQRAPLNLDGKEGAGTPFRTARSAGYGFRVRRGVVGKGNIPWPTRGPNVDWTIGSTMRRGNDPEAKVPANDAVRTSSSPSIVVPDTACHAGGRGFESRRSRPKNPASPHTALPGQTPTSARPHKTDVRGGPNVAKNGPESDRRVTISSRFEPRRGRPRRRVAATRWP